jgi:CheY-like chemotaxis protein
MPKSARGARVMDIETLVFPDPTERTPTVLVVDDEVLLRMNLSDFLQECGFKVLEASSADEAIGMVESYTGRIDLVFSDVMMPGQLDGFGLAQWVHANRPDLPVVLCSGDTRKAETAQHLCAGEPFLTKPFDLHMAVAKIRQLLELREETKPAPN